MNSLDWTVLIGYFGVMVAIGIWSHKRVGDVHDYFTMRRQDAVVAVGHLAPHVRLQRGDVHRIRGHRVHVRRHVVRHLVVPHRHRYRDRCQALRTPPQPGALATAGLVAAGVSEEPLQPAHPAGPRLVGRAAEDRGRRRQVGRDRDPVVRLHRCLAQHGHPDHGRGHRGLLHRRRTVGGRADRTGPVHHPVRRRHRDARRRHGGAGRLQQSVERLGRASNSRATRSRWPGRT